MLPKRAMQLLRRALDKPPSVIARRVAYEASAEAERYLAPWRAARFDGRQLLKATGDTDLETLWRRLAARPYPAYTSGVDVRRAPARYAPATSRSSSRPRPTRSPTA